MSGRQKNLGRAYLVAKLQERGCSRRQAVEILNTILHEMSQALKRGKRVEFPFGYLERTYTERYWHSRLSRGEEPRQPYTVVHVQDEAGYRLLNGPEGG
jgi:nucleoid DNA-binding protein